MNILPKKSWHVRNKDNVARVRRDEAKALDEEREVAKRKAFAEQEARIQVLRDKAKAAKAIDREQQWDLPQEPATPSDDSSEEEHTEVVYSPLNTAFPPDKHINLFDVSDKSQGANRDYEKEKRKAQEDYEKKIGYLTYLGQSATELSAEKPWYERISRSKKDDISSSSAVRTTFSEQESMLAADPLRSMKASLDKKKQAEDKFYGRTKEVSLRIDGGGGGRRKRHIRSEGDEINNNIDSLDKRVKQSETSPNTEISKHHKHKKSKKKSKKHKKSSSESSPKERKPTLEELRAERFEREARERQRSINLVSRLQRGVTTPARSIIDERGMKYNTVYNMAKR